MTESSGLSPAAQETLAGWHRFVVSRDMTLLRPLLADSIVFRSPYVQTPMAGRAMTELVLATVMQVFENFRYHRTFVAAPRDVCLEFGGNIGQWDLKGVDLIGFDEAGRISQFEVMVRPFKALAALGDAMNARIGPEIIRLKAAAASR